MGKLPAFVEKIFILLLGTFFSLAAFELLLHIIGFTYNLSHQKSAPQVGHVDILCLGNSHTAGYGAPAGHSYCDHLLTLYNQNSAAPKLTMMNLGKLSYNTTNILSSLEQDLKYYTPRLVILMAGEPNEWNRSGFAEYKARQRPNRNSFNVWLDYSLELVQRLRTFRFFSHVATVFGEVKQAPRNNETERFQLSPWPRKVEPGYSWMSRILERKPEALSELTEGEAADVLKILKALHKETGRVNRNISLAIGRLLFFRLGKQAEALDWYQNCFNEEPHVFSYHAYLDLLDMKKIAAQALQKKITLFLLKAKKHPFKLPALELARGLQKIPSGYELELHERYRKINISQKKTLLAAAEELSLSAFGTSRITMFVGDHYFHGISLQKAIAVLDRHLIYFPFDPEFDPFTRFWQWRKSFPQYAELFEETAKNFLARFPDQQARATYVETNEIFNWVKVDLASMALILKKHDTKFVFMTYPPLVQDLSSRYVDRVIRQFAANIKVPLFDTQRGLAPVFSREKNLAKYYSSDASFYDNHLTSEGYRQVAIHLFQYLKREMPELEFRNR